MRAGTTSLYNFLTRHPLVRPGVMKEVHFFDLNHHRGLDWYRAHFPLQSGFDRRAEGRGGRALTGEASPYYLFHPLVAERVAADLPGVRLIVILRDPIQRAYSHYWHCIRWGEENLSFEAAIALEPHRLAGQEAKIRADARYISPTYQPFSYLARGEYASQLAHWFDHFPREQILILENKTFYREAAAPQKLLAFLGLPESGVSPTKRFNQAEYPPMNPATHDRLREYFRPHNARLYEMLGVEFPWDD